VGKATGGSGGAKLRKCAGCLELRYCSPACQKGRTGASTGRHAMPAAAQQARGRQQ
jgi:hypothetical protein